MAMFLLPRIAPRLGMRALILVGLAVNAAAYWQMMHFNLLMGQRELIISGLFQGFGVGMFFVPLTSLAFATVRPEQRAEASALFNLVRGMGGSIGVSVMAAMATRNTQVEHASISAQLTPGEPVVSSAFPGLFSHLSGLAELNGEITRQATMVAYADDFLLLFMVCLVSTPLVFLLRSRRSPELETVHAVVE